jgi:hypothetical protein
MVLSSPLLFAVVRADWSPVALDTQKVAPKEKVGIKNSDNAEMKRMDHFGKVLLTSMVKPPTSLMVADQDLCCIFNWLNYLPSDLKSS